MIYFSELDFWEERFILANHIVGEYMYLYIYIYIFIIFFFFSNCSEARFICQPNCWEAWFILVNQIAGKTNSF